MTSQPARVRKGEEIEGRLLLESGQDPSKLDSLVAGQSVPLVEPLVEESMRGVQERDAAMSGQQRTQEHSGLSLTSGTSLNSATGTFMVPLARPFGQTANEKGTPLTSL